MRADRLLSILLLLQAHRRLTAGELARRLEVSERTIYRDMEALSGVGVPVLAERGNGGGWSLLDGYRTNLSGLTEAEVRALFLARPAKLLTDLGLQKAVDAAFLKLLATLPTIYRPGAEEVQRRVHLDPTGWRRSDEAFPFLPAIQEAVFSDRTLDLTYRRGDGATIERQVEPLGLVAKGNVWYLLARTEGEVRTYRVSRVQQATVTNETFLRPADFDVAVAWEHSPAEFVQNLPRYPAKLRLETDHLPRLHHWRFARIDRVEGEENGWVGVTICFEVEEEACEYVLSLGPAVEVLEPGGLRVKVAQLIAAADALYRGKSSPAADVEL